MCLFGFVMPPSFLKFGSDREHVIGLIGMRAKQEWLHCEVTGSIRGKLRFGLHVLERHSLPRSHTHPF